MRKFMTVVTLLLTAVMCLFGCGNTETGNGGDGTDGDTKVPVTPTPVAEETMPDYLTGTASSPFTVGMWVGIPEYKYTLNEYDAVTGQVRWTEEEFLQQYTYIKEAGFNLATASAGASSLDHIIHSLETAEKVGIKQLIWDTQLNNILVNAHISDKEAVAQARRRIMEYSDYDSFYGNMITDEPNVGEYETLAMAARRYKEVMPDKMFYLNLYPVAANTETQLKCESYEKYLQLYSALNLDYLCYDHYPLRTGTKIEDTFLYNLQLAQNAGNYDVWTFLQAMGYNGHREPESEADFRFQTNCALSYGVKAIQWFCYFSPSYGGAEGFAPAIITLDGKKTAKYDYVKVVNNELHKLEHIYEQFTWQKAMNIVGEGNAKGNAAFNYYETDNTHNRINKITASQDTVVGCFKDGDGRDGFMITNYDLPTSNKTDKVEIQFNYCTKAVCYVNGERTEVGVVNGKVTLNLKAGDGAFIIPLNIVN